MTVGMTSVVPVPLSGTVSVGVSRSFDGIERFALFAPSEVGEKTASIVQMPEG